MAGAYRQIALSIEARAPVLAIRALSGAQTIAHVINVFEQCGLVPNFFTSHRSDAYLLIEVELSHSDGALRDALLEMLREIACVDRAEFMT
jgi:hypothetical protein